MSDFLNMLVQRERGQADNAIAPRLPSRYEPAERKGSLTTFDISEHGAVNPEGSLADEYGGARQQAWRESGSNSSDTQSNGTSSESEQATVQLSVARGRKPQPLELPALREHDNAKPEHTPSNTLPIRGLTPAEKGPEPVGWVERSAAHHVPDGLQPPASTHPTFADNDLVTGQVTQTIAQPAEEFGRDKIRPITVSRSTANPTHPQTGDATSLPESTTEHRQSAQRETLSPLDGQEEARATKTTKSAKRRSISLRQVDNFQDANDAAGREENARPGKTRDEAIKPTTELPTGAAPESITEEIEQDVQRPAVSRSTITPTTTVNKAAVKHRQHASRRDSSDSPALANAAMEAVSVRPELTASRRDDELTAQRTADNASYNERDNPAFPVSREAIPARVTVSKPGDTATASSSGLLPSSDQETRAPPTERMPTINVTIGRIEVRAVTPLATPKRSNAGPKPMSLSDYLSRHSGGQNQRRPR